MPGAASYRPNVGDRQLDGGRRKADVSDSRKYYQRGSLLGTRALVYYLELNDKR